MQLLLAEQHEGGRTRLLAGSVFLRFGHTVFYAFNGRRRESLSLRPNDAILWQAIHDACRDGVRHFDFGEADERNPGLAAFKSKWGTEMRWLYHYYFPAPQDLQTGFATSDSFLYKLASAAWGRLPLRATALLGDRIYSYL
jgi:lipid II:glycine glycyltransferase (peptidoglycan interpeptide bridge formation enzyme)